MRTTFKRTAIVAAIALAMPAGALYASGDAQNRAQSAEQKQSGSQLPASELIGTQVTNEEGQDLGEIKDLMVDLESGRVRYGVLEFGGVLGMGEKHFAYPLRAFKPAAAQNKVLLEVEKHQLEQSEGFDRDRYPLASDPYWGRVERTFGATEPSAAAGGSAPAQPSLQRASKLIGKEVKDNAGKDAGELKDLIVDLGNGEVRHAVIDLEGQDRNVEVSMSELAAGAEGDELRLKKDASQLRR